MKKMYRTDLTTDDFDRFDRPSKRDCTASTFNFLMDIADDGIVEFYECLNDWKELKAALERGERPTLVFVPFDSPEANKNARADIYVLYRKNGRIVFFGIEAKSSGYPSDYYKKVEEGVYCDRKKMAFFKLMREAYGIPYYWDELYLNEGFMRMWNITPYLTGEKELKIIEAYMNDVSIDPNTTKSKQKKGGLPIEDAKVISVIKGENIYDEQRDSGRKFRLN